MIRTGIMSDMRRKILIAVAAVLALLVTGGLIFWNSLQPPGITPFYTPPLAIGDEPGALLNSEEIEFPAESDVSGARLWRILYTSSNVDGDVIATSGLIAAPDGDAPAGGFPVVVVAHGTVGIEQGCAPSVAPFAEVDEENTTYDFLVGQYVSAGYAVVMADFQGLGVAGDNSYLVGEIEGRNVLDSARALAEFDDIDTSPRLLVAGQSQGGQAALWAAQLAPEYAPELDVIGVVAQAPATNLEQMFLGIYDAGKQGGIVSLPVMAADAYAKNYHIEISELLTDRGRGSLANIIGKLCLFPAILGTKLATPQDLIQPDGLETLGPYIERNKPGTDFAMPIFLAQGDVDVIVQPTITGGYADELCEAGQDLTFVTYPGVGHFDVIGASNDDVLDWMTAVAAGEPPASTCE